MLVALVDCAEKIEQLRQTSIGTEIKWTADPSEFSSAYALVSGRPTEAQVESMPLLTSVIVPFAGVPEATLALMKSHPGLRLYNLHHNASSTAEMAIALMLAVGRRIVSLDLQMRQGKWPGRSDDGSEYNSSAIVSFEGSHALVIGFGEIGRRIARACLGLGMSVAAIRRSEAGPTADGVRLVPQSKLVTELKRADVVHLAVPLTAESCGMIGSEQFAQMRSNAILINVSRGAICDEETMYSALREGRIVGAGLDVWWQYPSNEHPTKLPSQFDFASLENVVMTPHVGGGNSATEGRRVDALADLAKRLANGESPRSVDPEAGY